MSSVHVKWNQCPIYKREALLDTAMTALVLPSFLCRFLLFSDALLWLSCPAKHYCSNFSPCCCTKMSLTNIKSN